MTTSLRSKAFKIRNNVLRKEYYNYLDPVGKENTSLTLWFDNHYVHSVDVTIYNSKDDQIFDLTWYVESEWPNLNVSQMIGLASQIQLAWCLWISDFEESNRTSFTDYPFTAALCRDYIQRMTMEEMI